MPFDRETFKAVVVHCGLTKEELGTIFQVSRQHIYGLMKTANPHNSESIRRMNICSRALFALIQKGVLPFKSTEGSTREQRVKAIVKKLYDLARPI